MSRRKREIVTFSITIPSPLGMSQKEFESRVKDHIFALPIGENFDFNSVRVTVTKRETFYHDSAAPVSTPKR